MCYWLHKGCTIVVHMSMSLDVSRPTTQLPAPSVQDSNIKPIPCFPFVPLGGGPTIGRYWLVQRERPVTGVSDVHQTRRHQRAPEMQGPAPPVDRGHRQRVLRTGVCVCVSQIQSPAEKNPDFTSQSQLYCQFQNTCKTNKGIEIAFVSDPRCNKERDKEKIGLNKNMFK